MYPQAVHGQQLSQLLQRCRLRDRSAASVAAACLFSRAALPGGASQTARGDGSCWRTRHGEMVIGSGRSLSGAGSGKCSAARSIVRMGVVAPGPFSPGDRGPCVPLIDL